ncbi:alpha-amylase family glycosyl hydrolase [Kribbella sp. NPDC051952]|uniref:alpha-amylase family glycosyl hydrolase n=1 Tax=Kribbella sp. NPDC051952 TaxID=3154851 RepID=UPI00344441C7
MTVQRPWWQGAVIYESHLPTYRDGNGDGIGDLDGLIESLDYLAGTLGVDALWVGPFFRSPLLDQGFDITDHTDVEPLFGTLETVDRLLAEAHLRGIRVIADYVPNHTSDEHPWFRASRSSRSDPKRDWYVWADPKADGSPPNNWISEPGGSAWEYDELTAQYYLHSHLKEQPDLNWRNPDVRKAMFDVLRFWLERGVDGFRIDVAHMLMKDPDLRDNPPASNAGPNQYDLQHPDFTTQLHVNDRMHPDVHDVLRQIRAVLDEYGDRVSIAEIEALPWDRWAEFFGTTGDGIHLPFAFRLIETPWRSDTLRKEIRSLESALPADSWPCLALGNHDRPRLASRLGRSQARVAAVMLLTLRGAVSLFYGDELGLTDQPVPPSRQRDRFGLLAGGVSRDGVRTPMPWNDGRNGGFSSAPEDCLWLPVSTELGAVNVEAQLADPRSFLNLYRQLIALRNSSLALRRGDLTLVDAPDGVLAYRRVAGEDRKFVALNLTAEPRQVAARGTVLISTAGVREPADGPLALGPGEGVVLDEGPL